MMKAVLIAAIAASASGFALPRARVSPRMMGSSGKAMVSYDQMHCEIEEQNLVCPSKP